MTSTTEPTSRVNIKDFSTAGYNRGAGKAKEIIWYIFKMLFFLTAFPFPSAFKCWLLRIFGAHVGVGVIIKPRVNIHFPWKLAIGNDVWIGEEALLLNFELLTIGNNVCVSQRVFLCGGNHNYKDPSMPYRNGAITLCDGSWIGAGCFIGPDVTVGTDTVVSAGSVVTVSLKSNSIFKGNPPVFIKERWM